MFDPAPAPPPLGARREAAARVGRRHRDRRPARARARRRRPRLARALGVEPRVHRRAASARTARSASPRRPARRRARADVVVTNHALLAIGGIEGIPVLPEHDVVDRRRGARAGRPRHVGRHRRADRRRWSSAPAGARTVTSTTGWPSGSTTRRRRSPTRCRRSRSGRLESGRRATCAAALDARARRDARGAADARHAREVRRGRRRAGLARAGPRRPRPRARRRRAARRPVGASTSPGSRDEPRRGRVLRVAPLSVGGLLREALFTRQRRRADQRDDDAGRLVRAARALARARARAGRRRAGDGRGAARGTRSTSARRSPTTARGSSTPRAHLPRPGRDGLARRVARRARRAGRGRGRPHARAVLVASARRCRRPRAMRRAARPPGARRRGTTRCPS